ncbi:hypothetical protein BKA70DRAFT_1568397 [Coprinopsis sp. MPI-PUGE-AT-0042]|nr:hypothetical protein BKA70DRAFT_1568397 [Coprinopsis sp. MPI-PUGE-AT-0042]
MSSSYYTSSGSSSHSASSQSSSSSSEYSSSASMRTSGSTPVKPSASNAQYSAKVDVYQTAMVQDTEGSHVHDVNVDHYAEHFNFVDKALVEKISGHTWSLDAPDVADKDGEKHLDKFTKAAEAGHETDLHAPFLALCRLLLADVISNVRKWKDVADPFADDVVPNPKTPHIVRMGDADVDVSDIFYDGNGKKKFPYGGTEIKPDFVTHNAGPPRKRPDYASIKRPRLNQVHRAAEFKKTSRSRARPVKKARSSKTLRSTQKDRRSVQTSAVLGDIPEDGVASQSTSLMSAGVDGPSLASTSATSSAGATGVAGAAASSQSKRKREDGDVDGDDEQEGADFATQRLMSGAAARNKLTHDHSQLAVYAMGCLSSTYRLFTTGIFINNYNITLFYYDRMLVLQSKTFNFLEDTAAFALAVYGMYLSDRQNRGANPFLRPWSILTPPKDITDEMKEDLAFPIEDMVGAFFEFPLRPTAMLVVDGKLSPVVLDPLNKSPDYISFKINDIVHAPIGLIGRATGVYGCQPTLPHQIAPPINFSVGLKLSFQSRLRKVSEQDIVATLLERISPWKDHLPEIVYSDKFSAEDLALPWAVLSLPELQGMDLRDLHVIASRLYQPIWEVKTAQDFMKIWIDCIRCHFVAWDVGKYLHRDLSENNLMFWTPEKDAKSIPKGVVNDWDMASALDETNQVPMSSTQHRTGTLPFMSIDLLERAPPRHYYRHDLESFFYILLWAVVRYDIQNGKRRPLPESLSDWSSPDLRTAHSFKSHLLKDDTAYDVLKMLIEDPTYAEWANVIRRPLTSLWFLFICAESKKPRKSKAEVVERNMDPIIVESAASVIRAFGHDMDDVDFTKLPVDFNPFTDELPLPKEKVHNPETCDGVITYPKFLKLAMQV